MTRRNGTRWLDDASKSKGSMEHLMRRVHTGNTGNPLDIRQVVTAIHLPGDVRPDPPLCADPQYRVLGRANVMRLGADDEAAFEHLDRLLQPIEKADFRPASASRSPTSVSPPAAVSEGIERPPSATVPERVNEMNESHALDPIAAAATASCPPSAGPPSSQPASDSQRPQPRGSSAPYASSGSMDRFASLSTRGDAPQATSRSGSRPRRRRPASGPLMHRQLADLYLPDSSLLPGGIPAYAYPALAAGYASCSSLAGSYPCTPGSGFGSRPSTAPTAAVTARSAAPNSRGSHPVTPQRLRSPEKLVNFGKSFVNLGKGSAGETGTKAGDPRASSAPALHPSRGVILVRPMSGGSLWKDDEGSLPSPMNGSRPPGTWADERPPGPPPHRLPASADVPSTSMVTSRTRSALVQRRPLRHSFRHSASSCASSSDPLGLITPVPAPIFDKRSYARGLGREDVAISDARMGLFAGGPAMHSSVMTKNALSASESVRRLIAGMMLGLPPPLQQGSVAVRSASMGVLPRAKTPHPTGGATSQEEASNQMALKFEFEVLVPTRD